nr:hypothetical protein [Tanacetum cinerariifolium]
MQNVTCFGCGEKGHYRDKCPSGRNTQNEGAHGEAYVMRTEEPQQDSNFSGKLTPEQFLLWMHTRASNSELVEPLPKPERTLNRRRRRRNIRVPYDQRNNAPQHPRIVCPPILDINHFRHFLVTLENLSPIDDEPMWAADRVVALTPGSAITIPESANEFAIKRDTENEVVRLMMFPLSLTGEAKTWLDELNEGTIETWDELRTAFISRFFPQLFSTDSLEKSELSLNMKMNH